MHNNCYNLYSKLSKDEYILESSEHGVIHDFSWYKLYYYMIGMSHSSDPIVQPRDKESSKNQY